MYPRIRDLRQDRDLNQTQVAKMLGMSQTGYSKYETCIKISSPGGDISKNEKKTFTRRSFFVVN